MVSPVQVATGLFSPKTMKSALGMGGDSQQASSSAIQSYADMTRAMWYSFMQQAGAPQEDQLIQYATDPNVVADAMAEAGADARGAFERQGEAATRRLEGLGLTLAPDEQAAADRSANLAGSLAEVGSMNRARDQTRARQQAILGNPAPSMGAGR
jgi:hypothetical protein